MSRLDHADRRIILLLGTPRSGSTWLAQILNSYGKVVYSHEALTRLEDSAHRSILEEIKGTGTISREGRATLVREWSRAHHDVRRPPFFPKEFRGLPSPLMLLAWIAARSSPRGKELFRACFSPPDRGDFEVLIKEVGWAIHARAIVSALEPELILIYRHPCAVVASQLRGRRLGLLADDQAEWLDRHEALYEPLGFDRRTILGMESFEYLALQWLLSNRLFRDLAGSYRRSIAVVHERLCREPEAEARRVFDFLGWPMRPRTGKFLRRSTNADESSLASRLQFHHSYFRIFRDPIKSSEAWRSALTGRQKDRILAIIRPHFPYEEFWGEEGATVADPRAIHTP